jgi:RimJ/RimL family protein N-acetyltransferase
MNENLDLMSPGIDLGKISLTTATKEDQARVISIDRAHDEVEHVELRREEKISRAISNKECFIISAEHEVVGYIIFDYRFFDRGWIELIIIDKKYRGKGIGGMALERLCQQCKTNQVFTSTNESNVIMQQVLSKIGFTFAGKIEGLDEGDPELFYCRMLSS